MVDLMSRGRKRGLAGVFATQRLADSARIADRPTGLAVTTDEATAAVTLLDQYGALEFSGEGADRAVRIEKGMRQ